MAYWDGSSRFIQFMSATLYQLMFSFLPAPIMAGVLGLFALVAIVIVMKIVALVLDAIPFL